MSLIPILYRSGWEFKYMTLYPCISMPQILQWVSLNSWFWGCSHITSTCCCQKKQILLWEISLYSLLLIIYFFLTPTFSFILSLLYAVVQLLSHVRLFVTPWTQHTRFPCLHHSSEFAQTHVHWVCNAIQPSDPLSSPFSCLQSFSSSGSFPMSQFFASGGQSIGVSISASVFPMNIQEYCL